MSTRAKFVLMHSVVRTAQEALYLLGGSAYFNTLPLERMYRDAISGPFHSLNFADSEEALGKAPRASRKNAEPRWVR